MIRSGYLSLKKRSLIETMVFSTAVLSIVLALFVMIGWLTKSVVLVQILPTFVPMQFNTALGFLLCGSAMISLQKSQHQLARLLAIVVGLIGALTIIEYAAELNLGIDELFMKHDITVETSHAGRMAPNTAFCFLLSGIVIGLGTGGLNKIKLGGVLGSLIFGVGLVAFMGYLIGAEVGYGWGKLTRMALHTSFGFVLLGIGLTSVNVLKIRQINRSLGRDDEPWLVGYAIVIALSTLFADVKLPLGVATGLLYVILVLFGWFFKKSSSVIILALCASLLIILGYVLSPQGGEMWMATTNRIFTLITIWLVAALLNHIKRKELVLEKINVALDRRIAETAAKNKELEQFVYIASHDLQEPLRTVRGFTQLIRSDHADKFDKTAQQCLDYILSATDRMTNLIKGLLDYSRIGQGRKLDTINCNSLIEEIRKDLNSRIQDSKANLTVGELPELHANETEMRMLFQNLLSNALKFTKEGISPKIEISAERKGQDWEFLIRDNGIGIPEEHRNKIFSIFQRLHIKDKYEGTGIGLAHCLKIIELHRGKIWVESEQDKGSTFYFTIPSKSI